MFIDRKQRTTKFPRAKNTVYPLLVKFKGKFNQLSPKFSNEINVLLIAFHTVINHSEFKSLVRRPKGESQNGGNKKTKQAKFSEKSKHFLPPDTHTYVGILYFLVTSVLGFALLPYYQRSFIINIYTGIHNAKWKKWHFIQLLHQCSKIKIFL